MSKPLAFTVRARPVSIVSSEYADSGDYGLIIANSSGHILATSELAQRLLAFATRDRLLEGKPSDKLPEWLGKLVRQNDGRAHKPPAFIQRSTQWGRFSFRAYRLNPAMDQKHIAIYISREEPMRLHIARGAAHLGLTPRQTQICVLLAEHLSHGRIAEHLRIKVSTVIDHLRKAYVICDAHDHVSLLARVGAAARQLPSPNHG